MSNDLVSAARELLRFRPGNTGPDSWTQFEGADTDWDALADAAWARFAQAVTTHATSSERRLFAAMAMQGFCTNPAIFAANPSNGWGLVNCSEAHLAAYSLKLADAHLTALRETP
jgi:hypothetical protein